jgi:transketolase
LTTTIERPDPKSLLAAQIPQIGRLETIKDIVDQMIDMMLNYRQSGHPGGSRSKVHALLATLLGGVMRWDARDPSRRFADRFILVAGHTAPLVYGTLPVLNEALRARHERTKDPRFLVRNAERWMLTWEDLLLFRRRGGLAGHAEMEGKTLFFKFNTGPSGHGSPPAAGAALALLRAGCPDVRVFAFEGEGGLTTGASHETKNSAWGLGLRNLVYVVDWNDFGIDDHSVSSYVHGTPEDWFRPYGWRVLGTEQGSEFEPVLAALLEAVHGENPGVPTAVWVKTRKGREYGKYDYRSHGSPHAANSPEYWETKRPFAEKYGVRFEGAGEPPPADPDAFRQQVRTNLERAIGVLRDDASLVEWLSDRLVEIGESVPIDHPGLRLRGAPVVVGDGATAVGDGPTLSAGSLDGARIGPLPAGDTAAAAGTVVAQVEGFPLSARGDPSGTRSGPGPAVTSRTPFEDERLYDFRHYPDEMWAKPGTKQPNRAGLGKWGAWVNAWAKKEYGRPVFLALSADLAESTNIAGFAGDFGGLKGWGKYQRQTNPEGVLLPQGITEFTNSGMTVGIATVNLAEDPEKRFDGFYAACSTYGSFAYLKYGPMRLFSQLAQDCELKVGKVLWVAGHSGPETADDSRTHFGIYEPSVTQLFPEGRVVDLHPFEHNEVPVVIAAGLALGPPILALHLTRPAITIPDREALGIPHHFEAAKGAYVLRDYRPGRPAMGCVLVQGTSTTNNVLSLLPEIERAGLNVKIVAAVSPQLFRAQPAAERERVLPPADRIDLMAITNRSRRSMAPWLASDVSLDYTLSADWDDRWRTGGTVDEVLEEAHLSPEWLLRGIERFVRERRSRLARVRAMLEAAEGR